MNKRVIGLVVSVAEVELARLVNICAEYELLTIRLDYCQFCFKCRVLAQRKLLGIAGIPLDGEEYAVVQYHGYFLVFVNTLEAYYAFDLLGSGYKYKVRGVAFEIAISYQTIYSK